MSQSIEESLTIKTLREAGMDVNTVMADVAAFDSAITKSKRKLLESSDDNSNSNKLQKLNRAPHSGKRAFSDDDESSETQQLKQQKLELNVSLNFYKTLGTVDELSHMVIMRFCQFHEIYVCRRINKMFNSRFLLARLYRPSNIEMWRPKLKSFEKKKCELYPAACRIFMSGVYNPVIFQNLKVMDLTGFGVKELNTLRDLNLYFPITLDLLKFNWSAQNEAVLFRCIQIKTVEINNCRNTPALLKYVFQNQVVHITMNFDFGWVAVNYLFGDEHSIEGGINNSLQTIRINIKYINKQQMEMLTEEMDGAAGLYLKHFENLSDFSLESPGNYHQAAIS